MPNTKKNIVLGIETSCDETATSIIETKGTDVTILSNIVYSQIKEHKEFGGVVPEIAARAHVEVLDNLINASLKEANRQLHELDAICVTSGPGLIGGLMVGLMSAKAIAASQNIPLIGVNHLEGHALSPRLVEPIKFPYLLLLVSGGHTQIILVKGLGDYQRWGTTIDDALGEAFDKTAKLLGLGYPGGPNVEKWAKKGNPERFQFPVPLKNQKGCDFSFSGLKTALRMKASSLQPLTTQDISDLCASFQKTIIEILVNRLSNALMRYREEISSTITLVSAGGVASNQKIQYSLKEMAKGNDIDYINLPSWLCTDNAAMIAWAGLENFRMGKTDDLYLAPRSRWPLDENSSPKIGFGRNGVKV